ncbi:unnamed protein product, partial [Phaeothamnion confervicola]
MEDPEAFSVKRKPEGAPDQTEASCKTPRLEVESTGDEGTVAVLGQDDDLMEEDDVVMQAADELVDRAEDEQENEREESEANAPQDRRSLLLGSLMASAPARGGAVPTRGATMSSQMLGERFASAAAFGSTLPPRDEDLDQRAAAAERDIHEHVSLELERLADFHIQEPASAAVFLQHPPFSAGP